MRVLLSIKPEFAEKIFSGEKQYEFRRVVFKNKDVTKIVVYASAPVSMVIGEFEIEHVISAEPNKLWDQTKAFAGITKEYFLEYFRGLDNGYAIKIKNFIRYSEAFDLESNFGVKPPQSFVYLS
jgi:predicted transcriptional regulator